MLCFYISFLLVLFGKTAGFTREYKYFSMLKSWNDAQNYCKQNYRGLAVITSDEEISRMQKSGGNQSLNWIGLYRSITDPDSWMWEDGKIRNIFRWKPSEPNYLHEKCVQTSPEGWNDCICEDLLSFYCYRILVLVTEKKTWEEANNYCSINYTGLMSPVSETQIQLAEMESGETQTEQVWTGLRFHDGLWLSVSKEPLGTLGSLPSCPATPYHCGARNTKTHAWENLNCNEKLYFICYN